MQPRAHVSQAAGAMATPRLGTLAAPCLQLAAIMPEAPPISLKFLGGGDLHHVAFSGSGDLKPLCHPVFLPLSWGLVSLSGAARPAGCFLPQARSCLCLWEGFCCRLLVLGAIPGRSERGGWNGYWGHRFLACGWVDGLRDLPRRPPFCDSLPDSMAAACIVVDHPWQFNRLFLRFHGASCMPRCTLQAPGPGEWTRLPSASRRAAAELLAASKLCQRRWSTKTQSCLFYRGLR